MKRTWKISAVLAFILLNFAAIPAFSQIERQYRYFEIGVDADAGVSNNYFKPTEILVEELVIDLKEMYDKMPENGLVFDFSTDDEVFLRMNFGKQKNVGFKLFAGVEGAGYFNISKNLFKVLGEGISLNSNENIELNVNADVFINAGLMIRTKIFGNSFTVTPVYYIPVIYVPDTLATVNYKTTSGGKYTAHADAEVSAYSIVDIQNPMNFDINQIMKSGGFSIKLALERKFFKTLDLEFSADIPIVPGTLGHKISTHVWANAEFDNPLGLLDETESHEYEYGMDEITYTEETHSVYKPMRFRLAGAYRPFGNWLSLYPMAGVVVRSPYSENQVVFGEYALGVNLNVFDIIEVGIGTSYENRVYIQKLGVMLNARILQVNVAAAVRGSDFANSFSATGLSVAAGVRIGF